MKKVLLIFLWLASATLGGIVFIFFAFRSSNRVIAQWPQPSNIRFDGFDPYSLSVIEGSTDYFTLPWRPTHELFIGRGTAAPGYGHVARFSFHPTDDDVDAYIHRSTVRWTSAGVSLTEGSGNQLFIPKAAFTGGR
jgi:hypothetical protein